MNERNFPDQPSSSQNVKKPKTDIVFFDFDGTLTTKDSLIDFVQYAVGKSSFYFGLISSIPMLAAYKLHFISNHAAKERFMSRFFKGWDGAYFQSIADKYSVEQIDRIIRPDAIEKVYWHKEHGHKVVVATASMEHWLKKWCEKYELDLIATRLEIQDGKLTGKFATKNCYGIEKVNRIRERYDLTDFNGIYAYGDSAGDKEMLSIANKQYYRSFD